MISFLLPLRVPSSCLLDFVTENHNKAMTLFFNGEYQRAVEAFSRLAQQYPDDTPIKMTLERLQYLVQHPQEVSAHCLLVD